MASPSPGWMDGVTVRVKPCITFAMRNGWLEPWGGGQGAELKRKDAYTGQAEKAEKYGAPLTVVIRQ